MQINGHRLQHSTPRTAWLASFAGTSQPAFDALEARLALSSSPLPHLSDMESDNDTVVRLETNYGDIDLELYNSAAPISVSNFLNYVNSGRLGDTFFHRSSLNPNPFVLQGGGYQYTNAGGLVPVADDAPIVRETTGKSNLARTVSMARTSDITSATSQFFINYVDNTFLDPTSAADGYAVFAKVIQGWDVVQTIEALQSLDLTTDAAFAGPQSGNFGEVPVGSTYNSSVGVRQADLVALISAEVIKPASVPGFFSQKVVFPEGFRSDTSVENLSLFNPNGFSAPSTRSLSTTNWASRDAVIASGSITPNTSLSIALSDFAQPGLNVVRANVGYSIEVTSAFPEAFPTALPVAASMNRFDYNADTGETFLNPTAVTATGALQSWDLPRIERNDLSREFILFQNLSDTATAVTTVFHTTGERLHQPSAPLDPYRRGGLEVFSLGLPDGVLWAHVSADQDIAVAMSDWDLPSTINSTAVPQEGFTVMGVPGGGSTAGGYAGGEIQTDFTTNVSVVNSGANAATVTLKFLSANGFTSTQQLSIASGGRSDLDLDAGSIGIPVGSMFTISYTSDNPVSAQYTSYTRVPGLTLDGIASTFTSSLPSVALFADGEMDPTLGTQAETETISLSSPFLNSLYAFTYTVQLTSSPTERPSTGASGSLNGAGRVDIVSGAIQAVRDKASSNPLFQKYGIEVIGTATNNATGVATAIAPVTVMTRWDNSTGKSISSSPMLSGVGLGLDDPIFT